MSREKIKTVKYLEGRYADIYVGDDFWAVPGIRWEVLGVSEEPGCITCKVIEVQEGQTAEVGYVVELAGVMVASRLARQRDSATVIYAAKLDLFTREFSRVGRLYRKQERERVWWEGKIDLKVIKVTAESQLEINRDGTEVLFCSPRKMEVTAFLAGACVIVGALESQSTRFKTPNDMGITSGVTVEWSLEYMGKALNEND